MQAPKTKTIQFSLISWVIINKWKITHQLLMMWKNCLKKLTSGMHIFHRPKCETSTCQFWLVLVVIYSQSLLRKSVAGAKTKGTALAVDLTVAVGLTAGKTNFPWIVVVSNEHYRCNQWNPHWLSSEDNYYGHSRPDQTGGLGQSVTCPCGWDGYVDCKNHVWWLSAKANPVKITEYHWASTWDWFQKWIQFSTQKDIRMQIICLNQNTTLIYNKMWAIKLLYDQNLKLLRTLWDTMMDLCHPNNK